MLTNLSKSESLNLKFKDFSSGSDINDFVKKYNKTDGASFTVQILDVISNGNGLTVVYLKHDADSGKVIY